MIMTKKQVGYTAIVCMFILLIGGIFSHQNYSDTICLSEPMNEEYGEVAIIEIGNTSYSEYDDDRPTLTQVRWEYVRSFEHLKVLSEDYDFQYPSYIDSTDYTYIISMGCKVIEAWTEEKNGDDYILNVIYDPNYQGKQVFFYQLPKIKIYPFKWPSYILNDEKKLLFGSSPYDYKEELLKGDNLPFTVNDR